MVPQSLFWCGGEAIHGHRSDPVKSQATRSSIVLAKSDIPLLQFRVSTTSIARFSLTKAMQTQI